MFRHTIVIVESAAAFNRILKKIKLKSTNIYYREKREDEDFKLNTYVEILPSYVSVSTKKGSRGIEYKFSLTGTPELWDLKTGGESFGILSQYYKIQRIDDPDDYGSASQFIFKNMKFDGKRVRAWSYDMNSAFAWAMIQPIPNIDTLELDAILKDGQIGFYESENQTSHQPDLKITFQIGKRCEFVCDLMPAPEGLKKFVNNWYKRKKRASLKFKSATNQEERLFWFKERLKAKNVLNMSVGSMQNYNPFLRACIIGRCNAYITSFIDSETIYANTDCIVSSHPRKDLEDLLGDDIGQFKLEHDGDFFAWQPGVFNYQWNFQIPAVRGVPKGWFLQFNKRNSRKFDILKDDMPNIEFNEYFFNKETFQVEEVKYA